MLKAPKRPKRSASIDAKENWLKRVAEIRKENAKRAALNKRSEELSKKIAGTKL